MKIQVVFGSKVMANGLLLMAILAFTHSVSQTIKIKAVTDIPDVFKVRSAMMLEFYEASMFQKPAIETKDHYLLFDRATNYSSVYQIDKNTLNCQFISFGERDIKSVVREKTGSGYLGDILYSNVFLTKDGNYDFLYCYKDKDKEGNHVVSTSLFRVNDKNECIIFKRLFQLPSISSDNYGEVIDCYYSYDKTKICMINSVPYSKNENLKLEWRLFDANTFNLIDSKTLEMPFAFKGRAKSLAFKSYKFKNSFIISLVIEDENKMKGFLALYFKESDGFKPHLIYQPIERYHSFYYDIVSTPFNQYNAYLTLYYSEVNQKTDKKNKVKEAYGMAYAYLDLENDKMGDMTEIPFDTKEASHLFENVTLSYLTKNKIICRGKDEFVLCLERSEIVEYQSRYSYSKYKRWLGFHIFLIKDRSIQKIHEIKFSRTQVYPGYNYTIYPIDEENTKFIFSDWEKYKDMDESFLQMNGIKIDPPKKTNLYGLLYHTFDLNGKMNAKYILGNDPVNKKDIDIYRFYYVTADEYSEVVKKLIINMDNKFLAIAELEGF